MTPEDSTRNGAEGDEKPEKPARKKRRPAYYRKAGRKARKMGLVARDDEHAAQLLEERGIDVLNDDVSLLDGGDEGDAILGGDPALEAQSPAQITVNDAERLAEVHAIQRDLVKRRRRRLFLLMLRLFFFVFLPTAIVGWFYYTQASPLYETKSEFIIQKAQNKGTLGLGGLLAGTGFANSADSVVVQGYLTSREAMEQLDREEGYRAHFEQDSIDELHRLPPDATEEAAYKLYQKYVKVGYDPSEGVIHLQVIAADPATSQRFSEALISYAEERVDQLSRRLRDDQMKGSQKVYDEAERQMEEAQQRVLDLQQKRGVLSVEAEIASQMSIVNALEVQQEARRLSLAELLDNPTPNKVRVESLQREIDRTDKRIKELRDNMTGTRESSLSLAAASAELKVAEINLKTRQLMLQEALQQLEAARIEVNRQVRYLSLGVKPIAPDVPTYPRKLENTLLAFVIFMGIYILLSLTVSILREQVSV